MRVACGAKETVLDVPDARVDGRTRATERPVSSAIQIPTCGLSRANSSLIRAFWSNHSGQPFASQTSIGNWAVPAGAPLTTSVRLTPSGRRLAALVSGTTLSM